MRRLLFAGITLSLSLLFVLPVHAQDNASMMEHFASVSPAALENVLQKGQLLFVDNTPPGQPQFVTVIMLFNAPVQKVFSIITDYDQYAGRIPQTTEVKVTRKKGNVWDVNYRIEFKFSVITEHADYTLQQVLDPPTSITWTRIAGNLDKVEGSWKLLPADNGQKTIGFYRVYSDIRSMGFLIKYLLEKQPVMNTAIDTSSALVYTKAMQQWVNGETGH